MSRDDDSVVEGINEKLRELRESLAERLEDEPEATLPLLAEPESTRDSDWWEENVAPLKESIEEHKRKLQRDEDSHRGLRAELEVAHDILPEKDE